MTSSSLSNYLKLHDESILREDIRTNLIDWASDVLRSSGQTPSAHHRYLLSNLDLVTRGVIKRLLVLMPPGSAKSTYVSQYCTSEWHWLVHHNTSVSQHRCGWYRFHLLRDRHRCCIDHSGGYGCHRSGTGHTAPVRPISYYLGWLIYLAGGFQEQFRLAAFPGHPGAAILSGSRSSRLAGSRRQSIHDQWAQAK